MSDIYDWSATAADNDDADTSINWAEGQAPSTVNNSARAVMARIAEWRKDLTFVSTVGGTADALTLTSAIGALASNKVVSFKATSANTGAATVNVNGLGTKAIRKIAGGADVALVAGDMAAAGRYVLVYDSAANAAAGAWILTKPEPYRAGGTDVPVADGGTGASTASGARDALAAQGVIRTQVFTASGTYTPHAKMLYCIIEAVGGGGGGGGVAGSATANTVGSGGGAGGYSRKLASASDIGASKTVTIGAAGSAGSAGFNSGGAGGNTSVGALCVANGGSGGGGASGVTTSFSAPGAGGTVGTGDVAASGAPGGGSFVTTSATTALQPSGNGGSGPFGGGGAGVIVGSAGNAGTGYGSGGSGASENGGTATRAGGAGTAGFVIITEYCTA